MRNLYTLLLVCFTGIALSGQTVAFIDQGADYFQCTDITGAGDGSQRLFVVQRTGSIRIFDQAAGEMAEGIFLNISSLVKDANDEEGMLGLAFDPDYSTNGHFYVNYIRDGVGFSVDTTVIARYTNPDPSSNFADRSSGIDILKVAQDRSNHNAGDLNFGPDGYLYIPFGDSGAGGDPDNRSQDPLQMLGKMLRIDVSAATEADPYTVPADNPYVGTPDTLDEIWSMGLRNPWRFSFDRETGDMWIADVGQKSREEVNVEFAGETGGRNWGWNCREGMIEHPGNQSPNCDPMRVYDEPVYQYARDFATGGVSITGGFVYRGNRASDLVGTYICADYISNNLFLLGDPNSLPIESTVQPQSAVGNISSFGEDDEGNLFAVSFDGGVFEVVSELALPVELSSWEATADDKVVNLEWITEQETGAKAYVIERSGDGNNFTEVLRKEAAGTTQLRSVYQAVDPAPLTGTSYYRLRQIDVDGQEALFGVRNVEFDDLGTPRFRILPNPNGGVFTLLGNEAAEIVDITIFSADGRRIFSQSNVKNIAAGLEIILNEQPAGIYQILLEEKQEQTVLRLIIR